MYLYENIIDMVLVLKRGASKREIQLIEKKLNIKKNVDIMKYCGKIKLSADPLTIQNKVRDEWE